MRNDTIESRILCKVMTPIRSVTRAIKILERHIHISDRKKCPKKTRSNEYNINNKLLRYKLNFKIVIEIVVNNNIIILFKQLNVRY